MKSLENDNAAPQRWMISFNSENESKVSEKGIHVLYSKKFGSQSFVALLFFGADPIAIFLNE